MLRAQVQATSMPTALLADLGTTRFLELRVGVNIS